jgi:hypothetical protein
MVTPRSLGFRWSDLRVQEATVGVLGAPSYTWPV